MAYQLELLPNLSQVHNVFHVSQLRRCYKDPFRVVDHEVLELQQDLSYKEHLVRILDQAERCTCQMAIKFLKVQWSHHSEEEATWEREDPCVMNTPRCFLLPPKSRDEISCSGGDL